MLIEKGFILVKILLMLLASKESRLIDELLFVLEMKTIEKGINNQSADILLSFKELGEKLSLSENEAFLLCSQIDTPSDIAFFYETGGNGFAHAGPNTGNAASQKKYQKRNRDEKIETYTKLFGLTNTTLAIITALVSLIPIKCGKDDAQEMKKQLDRIELQIQPQRK